MADGTKERILETALALFGDLYESHCLSAGTYKSGPV